MITVLAGLSPALLAQIPAPPTRKAITPPAAAPAATPNAPLPAAQVVTIVHRLNGLKMFRMLLRSDQQVEAIAGFDNAINLSEDVHTNIIAGLALDDGKTIAAWLPDAEFEFGPLVVPVPQRFGVTAQNTLPRLAASPARPGFNFRGGMFDSPDLTVIGPDGKRLAAEFVGLDGATGLSILRLSQDNLSLNSDPGDLVIGEGEDVRVLNPEPADNTHPLTVGSVYVRMGTTTGKILSVKNAPTGGGVARLRVKSPRLSLANIGGVAVTDAGDTLGIVNSVEGPEATVLPTELIRRAATRVMAQRASVPRPWLGVKGEPLDRTNVEELKNQGWRIERANSLLERHQGILLTSIVPGSPAASAELRAGDVILKVNNQDVRTGDDFSWMLDEAGPRGSVTITLARPDRAAEEALTVELSALMDPGVAFGFKPVPVANHALIAQGIETIALQPAAANRLGASAGLLVVYVDPSSSAFDAGLQPGDVIELIDGKPAALTENPTAGWVKSAPFSSLQVVRKKQKLTLSVKGTDKRD